MLKRRLANSLLEMRDGIQMIGVIRNTDLQKGRNQLRDIAEASAHNAKGQRSTKEREREDQEPWYSGQSPDRHRPLHCYPKEYDKEQVMAKANYLARHQSPDVNDQWVGDGLDGLLCIKKNPAAFGEASPCNSSK